MVNVMYDADGTSYQGRNGMGKQTGMDIMLVDDEKVVEIAPINSKGMIANCFVQVPLEKVDELIEALKSVRGKKSGGTQQGARPRAVVVLIDGICQEVVSDTPLDIVVLDSSVNGDSDERTVEIDFGPEKEKYICRSCREGSRVDNEFVGKVIEAAEEAEREFRNFYRCPKCGTEWEDVWSAMCDDDCPECGTRHISPYKSEDEPRAERKAA